MRYEILGPLRVVDGGGTARLGARKIEVLLATLLIRADQVVPIDQLITAIWDASPPRRALATVHVYVSQLRKFLRRPGRADSVIVTRSPGYLLQLGDDGLDVVDFQHSVNDVKAAMRAGRHADASAMAQQALGVWRGPVLGELRDHPVLKDFATWLEELRLGCLEMQVSASLALDRYQEVIGLLRSLIAEHPLHEEFYRQLMWALARSGRRADALEVYRSAHDVLREELGLEPCQALKEQQRAILNVAGVR